MDAPLAVVIPVLNAEAGLTATLDSLDSGRALISEIIVVDGGSQDETVARAAARDVRIIHAARGRGTQLRAGATATTAPWLLFLHADTRLEPGWADEVSAFLARPESGERLAHFRFSLDEPRSDYAEQARRLERIVAWRCRRFRLPYGDQGVLISRHFYERLGGYDPLPLMEDVELVQRAVFRFGRHSIAALQTAAVTSARRYARDGYLVRSARNLLCLTLWRLGVSPARLARFYG